MKETPKATSCPKCKAEVMSMPTVAINYPVLVELGSLVGGETFYVAGGSRRDKLTGEVRKYGQQIHRCKERGGDKRNKRAGGAEKSSSNL